MGCGPCALAQISNSQYSLHNRSMRRIQKLKDRKVIQQISNFISRDELLSLQKSIQPIKEQIDISSVYGLQAGLSSILTAQRRTIWKLSLINLQEDQKQYENLPFSQNPTAKNNQTTNRFQQIQLDIKRTYCGIKQLDLAQLTNLLENITLYFEGVGYTQGMNFYGGFLLLCGFTVKQSYEIFIRMSYSKYFVLIRNFSQGFKNINCCVSVLQAMIDKHGNETLKQVKNKMNQLGLNMFLIVFSWFLSYFLYSFSIKVSVIIWDYILLSPNIIDIQFEDNVIEDIFGIGFINSINLAIKIFESLSQKILECQDVNQLMQILRHNSIQKHLTETKIIQLILECKRRPIFGWKQFLDNIKQTDKQLFGIIHDKNNSNQALIFYQNCKQLKRNRIQDLK